MKLFWQIPEFLVPLPETRNVCENDYARRTFCGIVGNDFVCYTATNYTERGKTILKANKKNALVTVSRSVRFKRATAVLRNAHEHARVQSQLAHFVSQRTHAILRRHSLTREHPQAFPVSVWIEEGATSTLAKAIFASLRRRTSRDAPRRAS